MIPEEQGNLYIQIKETAACVSSIKADLAVIRTDVALLKQWSEHTTDHCPMRERIRSTENGLKYAGQDVLEMRVQLEKAFALVQANQVSLASRSVAGVIGGGVVAIALALIEIIPRLIK